MSFNKDNLKKAFQKAGLALEFAKSSFARGASGNDIFGLDIRRKDPKKARTEYFSMWPGSDDNTIVIRDVDEKFGQVILTISEAEREFEENIEKWVVNTHVTKDGNERGLDDMLSNNRLTRKDVVKWDPDNRVLIVRRKTPKSSRTFLLGMDERQLFMTQVDRNITTVKAAHASLKTPSVAFFEGKAAGKTVRQGEWFFINLPEGELVRLQEAVKKGQVTINKKVPIGNYFTGRSGKPHTADELVSWGGGLATVRPDNIPAIRRQMLVTPTTEGRRAIYVRGSVRHSDHQTVKFSTWRKVIANTETRTSSGVGGGRWID